jgi:hypothetical protein
MMTAAPSAITKPRVLRIVVPGGQGLHGTETAEPEQGHGGFRAACEDSVGAAETDRVQCSGYGVPAGGASGYRGVVDSLGAQVYGDHSRSHVTDHLRAEEGADPVGSPLENHHVFVLESVDPTDT